MFSKLIGTKKVNINDADYEIRYYRKTNLKGNTSFSSEVDIGMNEKIIIDDHSMAKLEYRVDLVLPAALYSRKADNSGGRCK